MKWYYLPAAALWIALWYGVGALIAYRWRFTCRSRSFCRF